MKAQQRNSPRGPSGDRNKPSKAKEKKDPKEVKEAVGKTKEDKVSLAYRILFVVQNFSRVEEPCLLKLLVGVVVFLWIPVC